MMLYSVTLPLVDQPGSMASVAGVLQRADVPVRAYMLDRDHLQFMTTEGDAARSALQHGGFDPRVERMQEMRVADRKELLSDLFRALADQHINVQASFGFTNGSTGRLYVRVSDMDRAGPILNRFSENLIVPEGLGRIA